MYIILWLISKSIYVVFLVHDLCGLVLCPSTGKQVAVLAPIMQDELQCTSAIVRYGMLRVLSTPESV
jgi:hypothetical protein